MLARTMESKNMLLSYQKPRKSINGLYQQQDESGIAVNKGSKKVELPKEERWLICNPCCN